MSKRPKLMSVKPQVVFVLGGPGAGKGTQCAKIVDDFGFVHLSAGDLLRAEKDSGTEEGKMIDSMIKEGKIVPVEVTVRLLKKAMDQSGKTKFLIDGFPRNVNNVEGWDNVIGDAAEVAFVLMLDCPEDVMEARLLERGKTSGRTDDNIESIKKRFRTYVNETMPVLDSFEAKGKLRKVDATRPIDVVYDELKTLFAPFAPKPKVVFVLGGPGAGKGTQCARVVDAFGFVHLSAGDLLRAEKDSGTEEGKMIDSMIKEGKIVPVEVTVRLLKKAMDQSGKGKFLIDGFPRNENNLSGWKSVIGDAVDVEFVLMLDCPEDVMEARLLERGKTSGRTDDNIESIKKRFRTYVTETMPVLDAFEAEGKLRKLDATRPIDVVYEDVKTLFAPL